jgi:hypothetical protein
MQRAIWIHLKSRKAAFIAMFASFLLTLAFAIFTRCHALEQLEPAVLYLLPALPFIFTKVPLASTVASIVSWPFVWEANDIGCIYNGGGYYMGSLPTDLLGAALSIGAGILVLVVGYPRRA